VGGRPDDYQVELLTGIARAANDVAVTPRRWHIAAGRQQGKTSTVACAALSLGCFSRLAGRPIPIVAPAERQAQLLLDRVRIFLQQLPDDRATRIVQENNSEIRLGNGTVYVALPGGSGGDTLRAFAGVGAVICDEASRVSDDVFQAVMPMVAVSRGLVILLSTPNGRANLFGRLDEERPGDWHFTSVNALSNPRLDADFLESERRTLGRFRFATEYLCSYDVGTEDSFFDPAAIQAALKPSSAVPAFRGGF
jgi:hypothetical protein